MSNRRGRAGAPMVQPTKEELRQIIFDLRCELKSERVSRQMAEGQLRAVMQKLGRHAVDTAFLETLEAAEPRRQFFRH